MKLLAFETATEACSVALWIDGVVRERFEIAPRRHVELSLPWAQQLLAEAGIAKSQLDAIAVGRGPGAFTGVRLAIALAQGIALALDKPVVPVSTLAALAMRAVAPPPATAGGGWEGVASDGVELIAEVVGYQAIPARSSALDAGEGQRILAAIDARMGEVYSAAFTREGDDMKALSKEIVVAPDNIELPSGRDAWLGVGTGFAAVDGRLQARLQDRFVRIDASALPHAADVARLAALAFDRGEALSPERLEPAYLRDNVALTLEQQRNARAERN